MIKAYGLFWKVEEVFWKKQKVAGTLLGSRSQGAKAIPVDFREQRGIYALYFDYELVYVGQTGARNSRLFNRLKYHLGDHLVERWNRFSWFGTQWVTKQHKISVDTASVHKEMAKALNVLEAIVIAVAEPKLNLQRGSWGDAKKYFQYKDPRLTNA